MIRKLMALMVAIAVFWVAAAGISVFAYDDTSSCDEEFTLLADLRLLPDDFVKTFRADKTMKRSELAYILNVYMGYSKLGTSNIDEPSPFIDLSPSHRHYYAVLNVNQFGIMTGDGYGNFKPDAYLTYAQVIKVIMSALGYDELALAYGGYPYGYITVADKAELFDEMAITDYNKRAKYGDVIKMLAAALNIKLLEVSAITSEGMSLSTDGKNTLLSTYHNIETYEGCINAVYGKQALDIEPLQYNEIVIDNTCYRTKDDNNFSLYFGYDVTFYYDTLSNRIVAIDPHIDENKVTTVRAENIVSIDNNTIIYESEGKEKRMKLALSTDVVYNGRLYCEFDSSDFISYGTTIDFIDAGADNIIDIASITCHKNYVVKSVNADKKIIYDMYGNGNFYGDESGDIIFVDQLGNVMDFRELSPYDVVSAIESKDKKMVCLTLSNKEVEGTVEAINSANGTVAIDGYSYKLASNFKKGVGQLSLGQNGLFLLDINGDIASFKPYQNSYKFAYFMDMYTSNSLDGGIFVKMLTEDEGVVTCRVSKKFIADGRTAKSEEIIDLLSENGVVQPQIIRYYLSFGELKAVDTIRTSTDETNDTLEVLYDSPTQLMYNSHQAVFGAKVPVSPDTLVFMIPDDSGDEEAYRVYNNSIFSHDRSYLIKAYTLKEDGHLADAIIMNGGASSITSNTPVYVVESISYTLDENGDKVVRLCGYLDGKLVSYIISDESILYNLKSISDSNQNHILACGDVIKLGLDNSGNIVNEIELYYERDNDYLKNNMSIGSNLDNSDRMMKANVYSSMDGVVRLTQVDLNTPDIKLGISDVESIIPSSYDIYRISEKKGKTTVSVATTSDIVDYCSSEVDFSKVLMFSAYTNPGTLIIYN